MVGSALRAEWRPRQEANSPCEINIVDCPTGPIPPIDIIAENPALSNRQRINSQKENAASTGMDHGVNTIESLEVSHGNNSLKHRFEAMLNWGDPDHMRAMRVAGHALTLGTSDAWLNASAVWAARLSAPERVALAYAALKALDEDEAYLTASAAIFGTLNGEAVQ